MRHSKFGETQSTEKLLAIYNGETLLIQRCFAIRKSSVSSEILRITFGEVTSIREIVLKEPISDVGRHDIPEKVGKKRVLEFLEVSIIKGE
jgi:hypothetical protein